MSVGPLVSLRPDAASALLRWLRPVAGRMPDAAARSAGTALGELARLTDPRGRRRARASLHRALPDLGRDREALLVRNAYRHLGRAACDVERIDRAGAVALCRRLEIEGWEQFERRGDSRGVVLLGSPFGNPELALAALTVYRRPLAIVGPAPLSAHGDTVALPRGGSPEELARRLETSQDLYMELEPAPAAADAARLPFLGGATGLSTLPARVALLTGRPLLPVAARPRPAGRYALRLGPPLEPSGDERELLGRAVRQLETEIRAAPAEWPWMTAAWADR